MSWELSEYNPEQWDAIYLGLERMTREALVEALVACHIEDAEKRQGVPISIEGLRTLEKFAKHELSLPHWMGHDQLVDAAYERVREHMTCTTGGHQAYIDAGGYHLVTLADEEGSEDE